MTIWGREEHTRPEFPTAGVTGFRPLKVDGLVLWMSIGILLMYLGE